MKLDEIVDKVLSAKRLGVLTGAGISTLSGIPDFRGPEGLYRQRDAERIFDIDWFERDPSIYYNGCRELIYGLNKYQPNVVHQALKALEDKGILRGIATQNIDMLHQRAGSSNVYEVHGSPMSHHCRVCGDAKAYSDILEMLKNKPSNMRAHDVPRCKCGGVYKPDVTFFGESLPEAAFSSAQSLAIRADVMLVLGTSLTVFPAAGLPRLTLQAGGAVIIVNAQPTSLDEYAFARYEDLRTFGEMLLAKMG